MTMLKQHRLLLGFMAVCIFESAIVRQVTAEETNAYSTARIEALNKVALTHRFNSLPAQAEIVLPSGEKKPALKIKEELALHGVSITMEKGRYLDVSQRVANGHALNPDDQLQVAMLNYFHQNFGMSQDVNYKMPGEARARIDDIKNELEKRGISLQREGDLFIVRFVRKGVGP